MARLPAFAAFFVIALSFSSCSSFSDNKEVVFLQNFNNLTTGVCTESNIAAMWGNNIGGCNGVTEGRVSIVSDASQGLVLRVLYPSNKFESTDSGAQWKVFFYRAFREMYCSYKIKFESGFDFVKGGKLPGLAGGTANSGKHPSNGLDGFSARMMWRELGRAIQYVYHPGQIADTGDIFYWTINSQYVNFNPGQWHQIEQHIVMNTPGYFDGLIECWFDGVLALTVENISFRYTDSYAINVLYFSTFFGGDKIDWASSKDQYAYFDDFVIATKR